jgi:hypothetical protein
MLRIDNCPVPTQTARAWALWQAPRHPLHLPPGACQRTHARVVCSTHSCSTRAGWPAGVGLIFDSGLQDQPNVVLLSFTQYDETLFGRAL